MIPTPEPAPGHAAPHASTYVACALGTDETSFTLELEGSEEQSGGRATFAFFSIVDRQLDLSEHRFHAIDGGDDLDGKFLAQAACAAAMRSLSRGGDWPCLPTEELPGFGHHCQRQR